MKIYEQIENLLKYALTHLNLNPIDVIYKRNLLYDCLHLDGTEEEVVSNIDVTHLFTPNPLLHEVEKYINNNKERYLNSVEYYLTKIMGILTLDPSSIIDKLNSFENTSDGTSWFYNYMIKNNYIKYDDIMKNIIWHSHHVKNKLKITINLSKPEKSNEEIAKALLEKKVGYPKSLLAKENVGYAGRSNHPSRQNIRVIPVELNNEKWFWQYSPYAYFDEHLIVINEEVVPMIVNHEAIIKLIEYVDLYPHYFVGSNASLPRIGGSILNHEHYQGGLEKMPMHLVGAKYNFKHNKDNIKVDIIDWYNSVVRLTSKNKELILSHGTNILNGWINYENKDLNIISSTNGTPHNSAAVILRKENDEYILDMILRNNITNEKYPEGIFHAHPEYHHIKQEGIGLIESMGLFILPPRLKRELNEIKAYLLNNQNVLKDDLVKHKDFINKVKNNLKDKSLTDENIETEIRFEIDNVCENILYNTAVFKPNKDDLIFIDFLKSLSYILEK